VSGGCAPEVSVVVPAHNEGGRVFLTLEALAASTTVAYEAIVVDDGSTDGCTDFLAQLGALYPQARLVRCARAGVAGARNRGAAEARAPCLVFLDAHCFPRRGWLELLLDRLQSPSVGIATSAVEVAGDPAAVGFGMTIRDHEFGAYWLGRAGDRPYEVPVACGCVHALRRDVFLHLGGYDAMRTYGLEDVELSLRAWLAGWSVVVEPRAQVAHVFKDVTGFRVAWDDYLYNVLRTATLHLDDRRLQRVMALYASRPSYAEAHQLLQISDALARRASLAATRARTFGWLSDRFGLPL
jgi:glycosyltransferase involved in cell wall biosynthesis